MRCNGIFGTACSIIVYNNIDTRNLDPKNDIIVELFWI